MTDWEKFLKPELLKKSLISASIFLTAYEMCKNSIIDKPKIFYSDILSFEETKPIKKYKDEVLSLSKDQLQASLLWFKNMGSIDNQDIEAFSQIRKLRNKIAHDLPSFISESEYEIDQDIFKKLLEITHKIGISWVINYELPLNPEYDDIEVSEKDIKSSFIMMIQMMMDIAYDNEPEEGYYYKNFMLNKGDS